MELLTEYRFDEYGSSPVKWVEPDDEHILTSVNKLDHRFDIGESKMNYTETTHDNRRVA